MIDGGANVFIAISGTFKPFPAERIKQLYPPHMAYVEAVTASANNLVAQRYILPEDTEAYVKAAKAADISQ